MSKASIMDSTGKPAGIVVLTAGATLPSTEGPHDSVTEDVPADSGKERTLDLELTIWTLKTGSSDTKLNLEHHRRK